MSVFLGITWPLLWLTWSCVICAIRRASCAP